MCDLRFDCGESCSNHVHRANRVAGAEHAESILIVVRSPFTHVPRMRSARCGGQPLSHGVWTRSNFKVELTHSLLMRVNRVAGP